MSPIAVSSFRSKSLRARCQLLAPVLALALFSQAKAAETTEEAAAPARVLTLHDLIIGAINQNLELSAKRIDPLIQQDRLLAAKGAFDMNWVAGASYSDSERPQNYKPNAGGGRYAPIYEEEIARFQTGFTGKLSSGLQYELLTSVDRIINTTNSTPGNGFSSFSAQYFPEYVSSTTLTITQPLLKDFGFSANLAEVRLQRSAIKTARYELSATAMRILRDVSVAYYVMALNQENVRVKEEALGVADTLTRDNQRRMDEGRMASIDVTQAKARMSEASEELVAARNELAKSRNALRELTRDQFDFNEAEFTVNPSFIVREAPVLNRDESLATLFDHNPTYLASVELAASEDIRIAYAKNQNWPRVDLKGSFGYNGLSDDWSASYTDYSNRDNPTYSVGIVVSVPIRNRAGQGRLSEARNRKRQALIALKRTEVVLLSAFDSAQRDIASAAERVKLVKDSVSLASAALDAQQRILGSGKTTSFEVSQAQRDLSQARTRELSTLVDLNKAIAQYYFVIGTLPNQLRVNFLLDN